MKNSYVYSLILFLFFSCAAERSENYNRPFGFVTDTVKFVKVYSESGIPVDSARVTLSNHGLINRSGRCFHPFKIEFLSTRMQELIDIKRIYVAIDDKRIFLGQSGKVPLVTERIKIDKFIEDTLVDFSSSQDRNYNLKNSLGISWDSKWELSYRDTLIVMSNSMDDLLKYKIFLRNRMIYKIIVPDYDPNAEYQ
jgi:hypothetical protein